MEPVQHVLADNIAMANRWYTSLFDFSPTEKPYGLRYQLDGESFVLSPSGNISPFGLRLPFMEQARQRLARLMTDPGDVLGINHGYEEGKTATLRDPFSNMLMILDLANQ
ncbi:hypothetical protein [Hymenobacter yonginensis]|uniref:VOC domain-containing protein n=1 Tax=Hymenobacter yonginensis TaxID=748197 RepID=A0ABY7PVC8_9BACT|nr:hypothetical protein [Hymenobacter yonginensis]WBO86861.1 hypothetical protein O9Z63_20475 [Hymenobacter yonginensis]